MDECLWAINVPDLQKACYLARVCSIKGPRQCQYYDIKSVIQNGPTCGLTAISMLLNCTITPAHLLKEAQQLQYTNNGEMFSALYLYDLLCRHLPVNVDANANVSCDFNNVAGENEICAKEFYCYLQKIHQGIVCQMHEGQLNCAKVKDALINGSCLLVPYDPDFNHSPCLKMGHKAHWALIIGYLVDDNDEFFVVARHGKARGLAIWSMESLSQSNANLLEFEQPKLYPHLKFLLPPAGLSGPLGLRERAIIIGPGLPHKIFKLP